MIVVTIVRGDAEQRRGVQIDQPDRIGQIPQLFDARVVVVARVVDAWMAVVDLEVPLHNDMRNVLGGNRVAKIRMVQVGQNLAAAAYRLLVDRRKLFVMASRTVSPLSGLTASLILEALM